MVVRTYKNIAYGPHERNRLDAYIAENRGTPSPVLIYFHGGGYIRYDKSEVLNHQLMQECLDRGISVVSCNYRYILSDPFPAPMQDGTRAIQFVRHMANQWGFDPERIVSSGQSAGGHIALWNALRGNLAQPDSVDEIERQRSDVCGFAGYITQVSKDQRFYESIYEGPYIQPNLALFYGATDLEELQSPEMLELAEKASAIHYMSASAPPAFMTYNLPLTGANIPANLTVGEVIHHPVHGYMLKREYDKLEIPFTLRHTDDPVRHGEMIAFVQRCISAVR
ncbi:alpha/beta hydrolase [Paenibacillus sp. HB172176]|uniref:alpha/beta hydrolase n=1 Tax=Paenibacillus sp. HB172176 TaxID=2493690 RepID=UPI00143A4A8C|nr:alpha/beta hydrolase [Paenibacillus sp. HB172176]